MLIQRETPTKSKLFQFYDNFIERRMESWTPLRKMWKCYGRNSQTNSAVESWNHRSNGMLNKFHHDIYTLIKEFRHEARQNDLIIARNMLNLETTNEMYI